MKIYVLGDSHAQALGPRLQKLLPGVTYEAFPGYGTLRATDAAHIPAKPDLAVVILGGNDFGDQSAARVALVHRLHRAGAKVVWFGPAHSTSPGTDVRHEAQAESQRLQLPGLGVRWIDSRPWTQEDHARDGVHFTATGYDRWAEGIADAVRTKGAWRWWVGGLGAVGAWLLWRVLRRK